MVGEHAHMSSDGAPSSDKLWLVTLQPVGCGAMVTLHLCNGHTPPVQWSHSNLCNGHTPTCGMWCNGL